MSEIDQSKSALHNDREVADGDKPKQRIRDAEASHYEKLYHEARKRFDSGETREAAMRIESLLEQLLREIIMQNHHKLHGKAAFIEALPIGEDDSAKDIDKLNLKELCSVFDSSSIALFDQKEDELGGNDRYEKRLESYVENKELIRSFNFSALPALLHRCQQAKERNDPTVRLGVQQVLTCVVALMHAHVEEMVVGPHYHFLTNYMELREEIAQIRESNRKLTGLSTKFEYLYADENEERDHDKKEFTWLRRRGMLLNNDGNRNIALKVESFVRILSTLFEEYVRLLSPDDLEDPATIQIVNRIVAKAGYTSGIRFGRSMREQSQKEQRSLKLIDRIESWCDFDSDVGFGLLKLPLEDDERSLIRETPDKDIEFPFDIQLQNNFIVHQRETHEVNLCSFVAGYIQGVLEKICDRPVVVTHNPEEDCDQFVPEQEYCVFHVSVDQEKLQSRQEHALKRYSEGIMGFDFAELEEEVQRSSARERLRKSHEVIGGEEPDRRKKSPR